MALYRSEEILSLMTSIPLFTLNFSLILPRPALTLALSLQLSSTHYAKIDLRAKHEAQATSSALTKVPLESQVRLSAQLSSVRE